MYIYIFWKKREIYKINSSKEICIYIYIYTYIKPESNPRYALATFNILPSDNHCAWSWRAPHGHKRARHGPLQWWHACSFWNACIEKHCRLCLSAFTCQCGLPWRTWCCLATKTFCKRKQCPGTAKVNNTIQMVLYLPRVLRLLFCFIAGAFEGSRWLNALGVSLLSHFWRKQKPLWDCLKTVDISRIRK